MLETKIVFVNLNFEIEKFNSSFTGLKMVIAEALKWVVYNICKAISPLILNKHCKVLVRGRREAVKSCHKLSEAVRSCQKLL